MPTPLTVSEPLNHIILPFHCSLWTIAELHKFVSFLSRLWCTVITMRYAT